MPKEPTLKDIIDAYNQVRPQEPGIFQNFFDALMPNPAEGPPTPVLMTGQLGPIGAGGLPIRERLSTLMESPDYLSTPLKSRLYMLKGETQPHLSMTMRLKNFLGQARSQDAAMRDITGKTAPRIGSIKPPKEEIAKQGWISEILGVRR